MKGVLQAVILAMATGLAPVALAAGVPFNDTLTAGGAAQRKQDDPRPGARAVVSTIVLDAGHGGHDGGCSGVRHGAREKMVALEIALALGERIRRERPDVEVIFTRDRDVFVPLHERAAIANRARADLFVSIHCNAMPGGHPAIGSETYVMGLHTAQHNLDVAKRENAAVRLEADIEKHYAFDPESPAGHIILSMFQHAYLEQSMRLAAHVEAALGTRDGHPSRGVKQAGFLVLKETAMPSVLVETGYLTNAREEAYLLSEEGRRRTVDALFAGIDEYLQDRNALDRGPASASTTATPAPTPESARTQPTSTVPAAAAPAATTATAVAKTPPASRPTAITSARNPKTESGAKPAPGRSTGPGAAAAAQLDAISEPTTRAEEPTRTPTPAADGAAPVFYVQLAATSSPVDPASGRYATLGSPIRNRAEGKFIKVQAGPALTAAEAEALLRRARAAGFADAWIVGYREAQRLSKAELERALAQRG